MTTPELPFRDLSEFRQLVHQAFLTHARAGKSANSMTIAVLKNRLLQLTKKQFRETDYGYRSLAALLQQIPDLVGVDSSRQPALVVLRSEAGSSSAGRPIDGATSSTEAWFPDLARLRVRQDIWDAMLDVSPKSHAWDAEREMVLDAESEDASGLPILPKLTREDLDAERRRFAEQHWSIDDGERWLGGGGSVKALPFSLRGPWAGHLKQHVLDVVRAWIIEHKLPEPSGLLAPAVLPRPQRRPQESQTGAESLREYLLAVVAAMTEAELSMLQVPATAAARVHRT